MTPTEIEAFREDQGKWVKVGEVRPGDPPGSFSDVSKDRRDIYQFECAPDDTYTTLKRSRAGIDIERGRKVREIIPLEGYEDIKTILKGESYEMEITTERGSRLKFASAIGKFDL